MQYSRNIYQLPDNDIFIAKQQILSEDSNIINTGIISLRNLIDKVRDSNLNSYTMDLIDEKVYAQLVTIVCSPMFKIPIKQKVLELIADMCKIKSYSKSIREFWSLGLHIHLLQILQDKNSPFSLTPIITILSKIAKWTRVSRDSLLENNYLSILLANLSFRSNSITDQYSILDGINRLIRIKKFDLPNYVYTIIEALSQFLFSLDSIDETIGKAYDILNFSIDSMQSLNIPFDIDLVPLLKKSFEILEGTHQNSIVTPIISFFCNCIFHNDEIAKLLIQNGVLDALHGILSNEPSEELIIICLKTCANCACISVELNSQISQSDFAADAYDLLNIGSLKVKIEALLFFQYLLTPKADFFDQDNAKVIMDRFPDIFNTFADLLLLDQEIKVLSLGCLQSFYYSIIICKEAEQPSPPLQALLQQDVFEQLGLLQESENADIRFLAQKLIEIGTEFSKEN
ncbi:hypothetical protein GPJ56_004959 [Histomonas meleagridis]|uniref:uncharacterized protein n=1 Tax=Histomonas meleagridis TaxID=135588 RepID=UPI0035593D5A|nr:hypothetical protein GPJ56_004959 [Histomonas meleagridis]KAH0798515.1 hypothetical protein GO595_008380 [Histomonas meleagridis]